MWSQKIYNFFCGAFRPPFRQTPWIVLIYVLLSVVYNPTSGFNTWHLPDTDDYTRLTQVLNWLNGQGWYDLTLPRLYPQHPVVMHWARLPDLAIGLVVMAAEAITTFFKSNIPQTALGMLAAAIVPCFLLAGLLNLVKGLSYPMLGRNYAGIACFFVLLGGFLMFQFMPMRVDHHAYIILGAGLAFYALQNIYLAVRPIRMAALAAFILALTLWNGAEILPMLILFGMALTTMIAFGRTSALTGLVFGLGLLVFTACVLPLAKAPGDYGLVEYDTFSIFYVAIAGMAAAYFTSLYAVSRLTRSRWLMASAALFLAVGAIGIFLHFYPDFLFGPYAKTSPFLQVNFFPNISEARPLLQSWRELGETFSVTANQSIGQGIYYLSTRVFLPAFALIAFALMAFNKKLSRRQKGLWALYAFFCLAYDLLALFWEVRVLTYAQLFAIAPTASLMLRALRDLPRHYSGNPLHNWQILTVASFTIFPAIFVPGILTHARFMPDMLFYLGGAPAPACSVVRTVSMLQTYEDARDHAANIMAPLNATPEMMYFTRQNFISAPYHRNESGIVDMLRFYRSTGDDRSARDIAKRLDLDYVMMCKKAPMQTTFQFIKYDHVKIDEKDGSMTNVVDKENMPHASLAYRLSEDMVPAWLSPVPIMFENDFAVFRVNKELLGKPTVYPDTAKAPSDKKH